MIHFFHGYVFFTLAEYFPTSSAFQGPCWSQQNKASSIEASSLNFYCSFPFSDEKWSPVTQVLTYIWGHRNGIGKGGGPWYLPHRPLRFGRHSPCIPPCISYCTLHLPAALILSCSISVAAHPQAWETTDWDSTKKWHLGEGISCGITGSNPLAKPATNNCRSWQCSHKYSEMYLLRQDKRTQISMLSWMCIQLLFSSFFPNILLPRHFNSYWNTKGNVHNPYGISFERILLHIPL